MKCLEGGLKDDVSFAHIYTRKSQRSLTGGPARKICVVSESYLERLILPYLPVTSAAT